MLCVDDFLVQRGLVLLRTSDSGFAFVALRFHVCAENYDGIGREWHRSLAFSEQSSDWTSEE